MTCHNRVTTLVAASASALALFTLFSAGALQGCEETKEKPQSAPPTDSRSVSKSSPTPAQPAETAAKQNDPEQLEEDFSTPSAAVRTFIRAGIKKDKALLKECFAKDCEREFTALAQGTASEKNLEELAGFVTGGFVIETETQLKEAEGANHLGERIKGDRATVGVKFAERGETINLVRENGRWVIAGF